jgi:hypothetical protein
MPGLMADLRAHMATSGRPFDDLDHSIITHPLARDDGDGDALKRRVEELYAIGFRRILLTLPSDSPDVQWETLATLSKVVQAFT